MRSTVRWLLMGVAGAVALLAVVLVAEFGEHAEDAAGPSGAGDPPLSGPRLRGPRSLDEAPGRPADGASPTHPSPASADGSTASSGRMVTLRGRVVSAHDAPTARISVEVRVADAEVSPLRTDAKGAFETGVTWVGDARTFLVIVARGGGSSVAATSLYIDPGSPSEIDVGVLVLRSGASLQVSASYRGEAVADARVFVSSASAHEDLDARRNAPLPWKGWQWQERTGRVGVARFAAIPLGDVRILVLSDELRGTALRRLEADTVVDVDLEPARTLRIEVVDARGHPIPGVAPYLFWDGKPLEMPSVPPLTDASGTSLVHGLPPGEGLSVNAVHREWTWPLGVSRGAAVPAEAETFRIEVPDPHAIAWRIEVADGEMPSDGAIAAIHRHSPGWWQGRPWGTMSNHGVVRDGHLHVDTRSPPAGGAIARLEDGRSALLRIPWRTAASRRQGVVAPEAAVFHLPRTLTVVAQERSDGSPAEGIDIRVYPRRTAAFHGGCTDDQGRATFEGLPAAEYEVGLSPNSELVEARRRGLLVRRHRVDLRSVMEQELVVEVPPRAEARIQVSTNGILGFPPGLQIEARILPEGAAWIPLRSYRLDRASSEIVFVTRLPNGDSTRDGTTPKIEVRVGGHGFAPQDVVLSPTPSGGGLRGSVGLGRPGKVRVKISGWDGREKPRLQRLAEDGSWQTARRAPGVAVNGEDGHLFRLLPPARYRIYLWQPHVTSTPFVVTSSEVPIDIQWDLANMGWAEGEVELPEGISPEGLEVIVSGEPRPHSWVPARTIGTRFRVRIPGDHPVELTARHPLCEPHDVAGKVTVSAPCSDLRIRMIAERR